MKLLGKIVCAFTGHKRMRRLKLEDRHIEAAGFHHVECSRCGMRRVYKVKPKSADVLQIPVGRT